MSTFAIYRRIIKKSALLGLLMLGLLLSAGEGSAQTTRKTVKKTEKKPAPQVLVPIGVPQQDLPVVISRAEDFQTQNQQIITNTPNGEQTPSTTDGSADQSVSLIEKLEQLSTRLQSLESTGKNDYEAKQKRLLMNLDILTKAEQRAESLRKQIFELIERENNLRTRLEQLENDLRPEMVDRVIAFAGTLRPEELREVRRRSLEAERRNVQNLLTEVQNSRTNLETTALRADALVEKLRTKLEKDIDDALTEEEQQN